MPATCQAAVVSAESVATAAVLLAGPCAAAGGSALAAVGGRLPVYAVFATVAPLPPPAGVQREDVRRVPHRPAAHAGRRRLRVDRLAADHDDHLVELLAPVELHHPLVVRFEVGQLDQAPEEADVAVELRPPVP